MLWTSGFSQNLEALVCTYRHENRLPHPASYFHAIGNRKTQTTFIGGLTATITYNYDRANRLTDVNGVTYTWDDNGNLLNGGVNDYTYDSANRLKTLSGQGNNVTYAYNGLGDRLQETVNGITTTFTMDLNTGLTQPLSDGATTYIYGLGRIAQTHNTTTEYFLGDALGSVRQLTNQGGAITYARAYDPYGVVTSTGGDSSTTYGYTGEFTSNNMVYLRARHYAPGMGRFVTRDTWEGDTNMPMSYNSWLYGYGNPVKYTDPSGHFPENPSQILAQALPQYSGSSTNVDIFGSINNCLPVTGNGYPQYDLTGYLAAAMTKHGPDERVKQIANLITTAETLIVPGGGATIKAALFLTAYVKFYNLEASRKEWDIKLNIRSRLGKNIVLCGTGINCRWFDYSTPGNIHFGYIAGLAKIDHFTAAVAGGVLEQQDLHKEDVSLDPLDCFRNNSVDNCDNPQDQAAVDFGYMLAQKYRSGITDADLRRELQINGMGNFQTNPHNYDEYWWQVYPQPNRYGADDFNN